jgi:hypothetical protein
VNDLGRIWKEAVVALRHHPDIFLEGLRKTTKICQDGQFSDRDLNPGHLKYDVGVLITLPRHSVCSKDMGLEGHVECMEEMRIHSKCSSKSLMGRAICKTQV